MSDDLPTSDEPDVMVHAEPVAFRPTNFEVAVPRTRTRDIRYASDTPARGVHERGDLGIAARLAMTASLCEPATIEIVRAIVRAKRELGMTRDEVTCALAEAGMHRLSFMHIGKGTEIFGAQPGSPIALVALPAGERIAYLFVRVKCEWVPYRVRSTRDVSLLARTVRS
ncbi:MAG: hypothetical protein JO257_05955 [Deltaproteobacteria bacterium]|nr:hypothetical protein [Deltaproteobacteria bacterium]